MAKIDELMDTARQLRHQLGEVENAVRHLAAMAETLPELISAVAGGDTTSAYDYDPKWKDGARMTYEGKQEFFRLVRAGEKPAAIALRLRISLAAVNYQLMQMALKSAATANA